MKHLALALLTAACSSQAPEAPRAVAAAWRVVDVQGDARSAGSVVPSGASLADGASLDVGDGRMVIEHPEVGTLKVNARSRLTLKNRSGVTLIAGKLWALVLPNRPGGFEVETSNAVAGVRGTEFLVEHDDAGGTRVAVLEGEVEVADAKRASKQRVTARQAVVVAPSAAPVVQQVDPEAERRAWEAPPAAPAAAPSPALAPVAPALPARPGQPPVQIHRDDPAQKALEAETARDKKQLDDEAAAERKKAADKEAEQKGRMQDPMEGGKDEVKDFLK